MPIAVAILSAVAAYAFNSRLERKKSELKFVNDQLQYLYGPLLSLSHASEQAWGAFRQRCRPNVPFFRSGDPPSVEELEEWRHWMSTVFMPLNAEMVKIIIGNAHLVAGTSMPSSFLHLLSHVETYRAVIARWPQVPIEDGGDFEKIARVHLSSLGFPIEFQAEIRQGFAGLKTRQSALIKALSMW